MRIRNSTFGTSVIAAWVGVACVGCASSYPITFTMDKLPEGIRTIDRTIVAPPLLPQTDDTYVAAHTFTVFAIPTEQLHTPEPYTRMLDRHLRATLQHAGYEVLEQQPQSGPQHPCLRAEVKQFWFITYTWLMPIFVAGGDYDLDFVLESSSGDKVWEHKVRQHVSGIAVTPELLSKAVTACMTQVLDAVSSDEFLDTFPPRDGFQASGGNAPSEETLDQSAV